MMTRALAAPLGALVLGAGATLGACAGLWGGPADPHWRVVGGMGDGRSVRFAEVDPSHAGDQATYEDAAHALCRGGAMLHPCVTAFFLPGDRVPAPRASQDLPAAFAGQLDAPLAVLWRDSVGGAFHAAWNCARAPALAAIPGACPPVTP